MTKATTTPATIEQKTLTDGSHAYNVRFVDEATAIAITFACETRMKAAILCTALNGIAWCEIDDPGTEQPADAALYTRTLREILREVGPFDADPEAPGTFNRIGRIATRALAGARA